MNQVSRRAFAIAAGGLAAWMSYGAPVEALAKQQLSGDGGGDKDPFAFLDPELREAAHKIQSTGPQGGFDAKTLADARAHAPPMLEPLLSQVPVAEHRIPGRGGMPDVTVHVINSDPKSPRPGILHTHGGGYILGSARFEVPYLQRLAQELDCVVVTVEYRLAPETTYQGSIEDNYTALSWVHANAQEIGIDRARIALLGESAGGGHAALLAQAARDRGEVPLVLQALIYPMLDDRTGTTHNFPAPIGSIGWNAASNRFGWQAFLGRKPGGPTAPKGAVPARVENLKGLAPAFIGVGAVDLFVSEDIDYARRLVEAMVPTELLVLPGAFHGFDRVAPEATVSQVFTNAKLNALRRAFGQPVKI